MTNSNISRALPECERITRDLRDVLGHTLSVIVRKSKLAGKLFERDAEHARTEIRQVEQIARDALGEVRQAIGGYRAASLAEEFARAKDTPQTAGVKAKTDVASCVAKLAPAQEALLALVVREAVTNVVRHASAANCQLSLTDAINGWRVLIADDGCGTKLDIFIPRKAPQEATA